jgi:hypothetical protein
MGQLRYGKESFEFSDAVLSHLQAAMSTKLRRKEHFFLSWRVPFFMGSGRHAVWIDNGVNVHISFENGPEPLDMRILERLLAEAATPAGMQLVDFETLVPKDDTTQK